MGRHKELRAGAAMFVKYARWAVLVTVLCACRPGDEDRAPNDRAVVFVGVLTREINFRQAPSDDAPPVPSRPLMYYGQFGEVLEKKPGWVHIKSQFGEEGWLRTEVLGKTCAAELSDAYFERHLTAAQALALADDKIKEWATAPYVVAMVAPLEDFGGYYSEWTVVYRDPAVSAGSGRAFNIVKVSGAETDRDGAVWSPGEVASFVNLETGERVGLGFFEGADPYARASRAFKDTDQLFAGGLPKAVLELPPVADNYPSEYFGTEPLASLLLVGDDWRVAYYDEKSGVNFMIKVGCSTGNIKKVRYSYGEDRVLALP